MAKENNQKHKTMGEKSHGSKDSALGKIPVGWSIKKIGEIAEINPQKLSTKTKKDFVIRYLEIESIPYPGFIADYKL